VVDREFSSNDITINCVSKEQLLSHCWALKYSYKWLHHYNKVS